jgi:hypothetical protein
LRPQNDDVFHRHKPTYLTAPGLFARREAQRDATL